MIAARAVLLEKTPEQGGRGLHQGGRAGVAKDVEASVVEQTAQGSARKKAQVSAIVQARTGILEAAVQRAEAVVPNPIVWHRDEERGAAQRALLLHASQKADRVDDVLEHVGEE